MSRFTRESCYIQIAILISKRGTCKRLQVGAVITLNNHIVSTGYNGPPMEEEHCNHFQCDTSQSCKRATHAEANAINFIPSFYKIFASEPKFVLYVTHQPCLSCAKKIIEAGIGKVYYLNEYREKAGIQLLLDNDIKVIRIDEQGKTQN